MRISDWSSDVCSSDLEFEEPLRLRIRARARRGARMLEVVRQLLQPLQSALQARGGLGQGELRTERVEIGSAQVEAARAAATRTFFQASIVGPPAAQRPGERGGGEGGGGAGR